MLYSACTYKESVIALKTRPVPNKEGPALRSHAQLYRYIMYLLPVL